MTFEDRIARDSERLATGTNIQRVRQIDATRAARNGVPPGAWALGARKLARMRKRVWAKIA